MPLTTNVYDLAVRVARQDKLLLTLLSGNVETLAGLATADKTNLVAAINEVSAAVSSASGIDDSTTGTSTAWSSSKTAQEIDARVGALAEGAPEALDTLQELAQALGDNPDFAATMTEALGLRVRVDQAQNLTAEQQTTGRANIGAAAAGDMGDPETNFVTAYENALAQ